MCTHLKVATHGRLHVCLQQGVRPRLCIKAFLSESVCKLGGVFQYDLLIGLAVLRELSARDAVTRNVS